MSVILMGCLSACLADESPKKISGDAPTEAVQNQGKEEETFGLNDSAVFQTLKFTATEITESNGDSFFTPEEGNTFVGVKFTIENVSDEEQTVSSILLFDSYVDDVKSSYSLSAACVFSDGTLDGTIAPGKKLVGWYSLEVPQNWSNIELEVQANWLSNSSAKFVFSK